MNKPIATSARTKEICQQYGLTAKKGYGQNFIIEPQIVEKIASFGVMDDACTIEIGPGIGALTEMLAKKSVFVSAFEIDDRLLEVLSDTLSAYDNVEIIHNDILTVDLDAFIKEKKEKYGRVCVCANLPYYITTPILFKLFECKEDLSSITVMIQREVADRFVAVKSTKDYNALSVISQYLFDVKMVMKIPRTIFNPKPNVDSAVIQFLPKVNAEKVDNEEAFFTFVKACFKQRRKTLWNNCKEIGITSDSFISACEKLGLDERCRSEELSLETLIQLYKELV